MADLDRGGGFAGRACGHHRRALSQWCGCAASGLSDADMRSRMAPIVALNMGALFVSVLGLMLIVIGVTLG